MSKHYLVSTVFIRDGRKCPQTTDPTFLRETGVFGPFETRKAAETAVMRAMDRGAVSANIQPCDIDP